MAIRTKPIMKVADHQRLLRALQCRAEKVKQNLFGEGMSDVSNIVCAGPNGTKCYSLTPANAQNKGMWQVSALYNDRDYALQVSHEGLWVYAQDADGTLATELFSFTPKNGFQSAGYSLLAPGLLIYFEDIIAAEGCKK